MKTTELRLADVAASERLGAALARALGPTGAVLYLQGELGAGKTTLVRAVLRALGHEGPVRSPTFTLVEPYEIGTRAAFHLDLYRLSSPEELEYLGLRDLDPERDLIMIEWPERGPGHLPPPDLGIQLSHADPGRQVSLCSHTSRGNTILSGLLNYSHLI